MPAHAMQMCADDSHVYILNNQNEIMVLSAKDLSVARQHKLSGKPTAIAVCGDNIWVGDKSGSVIVLAASNFEEKHKFEGAHSKEVAVMTSNSKFVASGDAHRYFIVFSNDDFKEVMKCAEHKDRIMDLYMNEETLVSVTQHNAFGLSSLADKKFLKEQKFPH